MQKLYSLLSSGFSFVDIPLIYRMPARYSHVVLPSCIPEMTFQRNYWAVANLARMLQRQMNVLLRLLWLIECYVKLCFHQKHRRHARQEVFCSAYIRLNLRSLRGIVLSANELKYRCVNANPTLSGIIAVLVLREEVLKFRAVFFAPCGTAAWEIIRKLPLFTFLLF